MVSVSFGTEIASMRGAVAEKKCEMSNADGRTAFQLYIYDLVISLSGL